MFLHSTRLPHLLSPDCYRGEAWYAREVSEVLRGAWHVVCSRDDLAQPGDFLTCELFGVPLQLRNFAGEIRALSNVCAHRHCLISSFERGNSPRMECQYHGWEYDGDGRTRKIPQPKNFAPFERDQHLLEAYRVETCGALVFASLAEEGASLREHLGDLYERVAERFGEGWKNFLRWNPNYAANWKVPLENAIEAYHVPFVHPHTFREDPGAERSTHVLNEQHTWFGTDLPFSPHSRIDTWFQRCEGWLMRRLGETPQGRYEQHHIFPNLLFSFTDVVSMCQCVIPTGPTHCRAVVRQFGNVGQRASGLARWISNVWGRIEAAVSRGILQEDLAMFAEIQRGLEASRKTGLLGACEERIWKFQQYIHARCELSLPANETAVGDCPAANHQEVTP